MASFRHDPIAFLLDAVGDAICLWGPGGVLLYRNRAAERLGLEPREAADLEAFTLGERRLERRCLRFRHGNAECLLEIIRETGK